jgi:hypothetical protein
MSEQQQQQQESNSMETENATPVPQQQQKQNTSSALSLNLNYSDSKNENSTTALEDKRKQIQAYDEHIRLGGLNWADLDKTMKADYMKISAEIDEIEVSLKEHLTKVLDVCGPQIRGECLRILNNKEVKNQDLQNVMVGFAAANQTFFKKSMEEKDKKIETLQSQLTEAQNQDRTHKKPKQQEVIPFQEKNNNRGAVSNSNQTFSYLDQSQSLGRAPIKSQYVDQFLDAKTLSMQRQPRYETKDANLQNLYSQFDSICRSKPQQQQQQQQFTY